MTQLNFSSDMATAFAERGSQMAMKKMATQWKRSLTKAQKRRFDALSKLSLPKLREEAKALAKNATVNLRPQILGGINLLGKEPLLFMMMDLEYGIIGTMPPEPLKIPKASAMTGQSIKFGSRRGPVREGVVTAAVKGDKKRGTLDSFAVFIPVDKSVDAVEADQIIAIGSTTVQMQWEKEQPVHAFNDPNKNRTLSIPEDTSK